MNATPQKRREYWNHFIERWSIEKLGGGHGITGPRLRKIKGVIMADDNFWWDVVTRHGGDSCPPDEMRESDTERYCHCMENFWGMVRRELVERGIVK